LPRILITRAPHQASTLAEGLRAHGFETILIPTIELAAPTTFAPLDNAIASLRQATTQVPQGFSLGSHNSQEKEGALAPAFHWLLFTSANAVEAFAKRLAKPFTSGSLKIAAIGPATAKSIAKLLGTEPALIPPQAVAESLAEALLPHAKQFDGSPTRFLLIRAEQARDILPETLRKAGGEVTITPAYRTVIPQDSISLIRNLFHTQATYPDAITFTSSSTATNLLALLDEAGVALPPSIKRISIGPITSQTLLHFKLAPHFEARESTVKSLIAIIAESII
jgi:uroporphyrinogen-III synthase